VTRELYAVLAGASGIFMLIVIQAKAYTYIAGKLLLLQSGVVSTISFHDQDAGNLFPIVTVR